MIDADGYISGPTELIVEIAASSASYDLHDKLRVYRRCGVQEYLVWRVYDQEIDWFTLNKGRYESLPVDAEGVVRSRVFPGLWLNRAAMLKGDLAQVLATLEQGLASEEHAAFCQTLRQRKRM